MTFNEEGSQSKPVVLGATLVMLLLALTCLYIFFKGPNDDSVLFIFRSGFFHYPAMLFSSLLFGWMTWLGVKRFRAL